MCHAFRLTTSSRLVGTPTFGRDGCPPAEKNSLPSGSGDADIANNVQAIQALPDAAREVVVGAWVDALQEVFYVALPFVAAAFVIAWFIPELRLKTAADEVT